MKVEHFGDRAHFTVSRQEEKPSKSRFSTDPRHNEPSDIEPVEKLRAKTLVILRKNQ